MVSWWNDVKQNLTSSQWLIYLAIVVIGLLLRWWNLADKPLHHDEALMASYAANNWIDPESNFYRYNPLLHGPFFYNLLPYFFDLFGTSHFALRALPAFFASLLLALPLLFRRYLSGATLLAFTAFIAFSPTLIYFARFLREDLLVFFALALIFYGVLVVETQWKAIVVAIGVAIHMTTKESFFVHLALLLFYLLYEQIVLRFIPHEPGLRTLFEQWRVHLKKQWPSYLGAVALFLLIYLYNFTAGFRYAQGPLDGLYRKSILYWWQQHDIERIKGPFSFYLFHLAWYEFGAMLAAMVTFGHMIWQQRGRGVLILAGLLFLALFSYWSYSVAWPPTLGLWKFFKVKFALDAMGPLPIFAAGAVMVTWLQKERELTLAFWAYCFYATLFTYSFLGEKVPWLAQYIYWPALIFHLLYWQRYWEMRHHLRWTQMEARTLLFALAALILVFTLLMNWQTGQWGGLIYWIIGAILLLLALLSLLFKVDFLINAQQWLWIIWILFTLRIAVITSFTRASDSSEFIGQVHTTREFEQLVLSIRREMNLAVRGYRPRLLALGAPTMPTNWYMLEEKFHYDNGMVSPERLSSYDYLLLERYEGIDRTELSRTHHVQYIPLRHWWLPAYENMTLQHFLRYAFNHIPWNTPGAMLVIYAVKKSTSR